MGVKRIAPGLEIDGFRVLEKLHVGGMARLWSVAKEGVDSPLIMKAPILREGEDPSAIVGFEMERMILPLLSGPHVPLPIAAGDFGAEPWIVMERIAGETLLPTLDRLPISVAEASALGAKVALAVADLHRQNVIHFDVKPSNIIIRPSGEAVLIDFGLSRHDHLPDLLSEELSLPLGTGPYMSPEQVRGRRCDPRSDIFALGVMLYFWATGRRPFGYPRNRSALKRRLWMIPDPPRFLNPAIPAWYQEVVLRCLEVDPAARYPTAAQLAFDLAHPEQIKTTARAERLRPAGFWANASRWRRAQTANRSPAPNGQDLLSSAPIIMAAIDTGDEAVAVADAVRSALEAILRGLPGMRLACVNVLRTNRIGATAAMDGQGRNIHAQKLLDLKIWARPLEGLANLLTCHVLTASDPAEALLDYARKNDVDQIVLGAQSPGARGRSLGPVAARIVAEAPCSVTIVRAPSQKSQE